MSPNTRTRTATARQSWNDPLGFLGLDKLPPPGRMPAVLRERIASLEAERSANRAEAETRAADVRRFAASTSESKSAAAFSTCRRCCRRSSWSASP